MLEIPCVGFRIVLRDFFYFNDSEDREIRSIVLLALFASLAFISYRIITFDALDPRFHDNIHTFRAAFEKVWPAGSSEASVDAEYVTRRGYVKSDHWHLDFERGIPAAYIRGDSSDHYLVTYLKVPNSEIHLLSKDAKQTPNGHYFTVRYTMGGIFMSVEHKGVTRSKIPPYEVLSMFYKESP